MRFASILRPFLFFYEYICTFGGKLGNYFPNTIILIKKKFQ